MYQERYSRDALLAARRERRKRKRLTMLVSVALAGFLAVGGTVAFLVAQTSEVKNIFNASRVTSEVSEKFENNVKSDVGIVNTGDIDAYVRVSLIVMWVKLDEEGKQIGVAPKAPELNKDYSLVLANADSWIYDEAEDCYYYKNALKPQEKTLDLINECVQEKQNEDYVLSVQIVSSTIQAIPETAVEEAWGVTVEDGIIVSVA